MKVRDQLEAHKSPEEKNLEAVMTVLKFDGDIPLHKDGTKAGQESRNLANRLGTEKDFSLWYIDINPPYAGGESGVASFVISSDKKWQSFLL